MARGLSCLWLAVTLLAVNWITVSCCDLPYYGLNCSDMCGANLTGLAGVIRPPGYDSYNENYENSVECEWNIIPQVENVYVVITFDHFLTESCCDYLSVTADSFSGYSTELAKFKDTEAHTVIHKAPLRLFFYSDGSSTRRAFSLRYTIGQPPSFLSRTYSQYVNEGDRVLLLCNVQGIPPPVVTWYKNGLEIQVGSNLLSQFELQGNHLLITNVTEGDIGYFQCRAQNFLNETEQYFRLLVYTLPKILFHPTSVHFDSLLPAHSEDGSLRNEGLQAVFRCQVHGYPRPYIHWVKDGKYLYTSGYRSLTWLTIKPVNVSDVGNYTCVAYNRMGSVVSRAASLTIGKSVLCCLYLRFPDKVETSSWANVELSLSFQSSEYKLLAVSVAKEGHLYSPATYSQFSNQNYIRTTNVTINLGSLEESDTAVYSWRLYMSASTASFLPNIEVTSFIPVTIPGNTRVTVTPSSSFVRNLYGFQIIACFAESLVYAPSVRWFKNADQRLGYSSITGSNYTITFPYTTTGINVTHYTCSAQNSVGIVTNASVSVVVRGLPGGWSWWTDNSLCSVSCGPSAGIRIRTRRCYNQNGCSGPAINASTCYSYKPCLSVETTTSAALTVKTTYTSVHKYNLSTQTDAVVTTETASTVTSLPTATQKIKSPNKTISDADDKSLSAAVIAVACIIPTAIVTFVVTVAMMYYIFKRKDNDRDAPPERARNRQDVGKSDTRASAHDRYDSSVTFKNKKNDVKIERPQATNSEPSETVDFVEEEYYEEVERVSELHKRPFGKQTSSSARKPQASYEGSYKHPKPQASEGSYKHPKPQTSYEGGYKHPKPQTSYDKLSSNVRPSTKASTSVRYVNVPSQHSSQTQQQYEEDDFYVQPDGCVPDKRH